VGKRLIKRTAEYDTKMIPYVDGRHDSKEIQNKKNKLTTQVFHCFPSRIFLCVLYYS